jgi:hypothetical protein
MPPAFCALSDVYSDWNFDKTKQQQQQQQRIEEKRPQIQPVAQPNKSKEEENLNVYDSSETQNDIRSFCPNCKNCLKANDILQQRIIEQTIWPRPQWVPQYPDAYIPYDPYNRYWSQTQPLSQREDFGNTFEELTNIRQSPDNLLQILLLILIALFIIQLVEIIYHKD